MRSMFYLTPHFLFPILKKTIPNPDIPWILVLVVFFQVSRTQPTMKEAGVCHRGTQRNEGTWDELRQRRAREDDRRDG